MKIYLPTIILFQCLITIYLQSCNVIHKKENIHIAICTEADSAFNGDLPYEEADIAVEYFTSSDSLPAPTNYHYKTCLFDNIKILITTSSGEESDISCQHDYFILKGKEYTKVSLGDLFNDNKELLLKIINLEFNKKLLNNWTAEEIQSELKMRNTSSLLTFEGLYMTLDDDTVTFSPIIFDEEHQSLYEQKIKLNINEVSPYFLK